MNNIERYHDVCEHSKLVMNDLMVNSEDAEHKTDEGYPFNCFSDTWELGYKNTIRIEWMHTISIDLQIDIRLAYASICRTKKSMDKVSNALKQFFKHANNQLSKASISNFVAYVRNNYRTDDCIKKLKILLESLAFMKPEVYEPLYQHIGMVTFRKPNQRIFDVETGVLSDIENESLAISLNEKSRRLFSKLESFSLINIRNFLMLRLTQSIFRRSVNLRQLKWCDLSVTNHAIEPDYRLKIPMGKQGDSLSFRSVFEDTPMPLAHELLNELIQYRDHYFAEFLNHLNVQRIKLSKEAKEQLLPALPIFFDSNLFKAHFASEKAVLSSITKYSEGFHVTVDVITITVKRVFDTLIVNSDRVANLSYSNNRQRHTVATNMAVNGIDKAVMAKVMGHSSTTAINSYIDIDPAMMRKINTSVQGMDLLQKAYEGQVTDLISNYAIHAYDNGQLTEVGDGYQPSCNQCHRKRPTGCYGCRQFRPLRTGNHLAVYKETVTLYETRLQRGESEQVLSPLRNAIKWIAVTIKVCGSVEAHSLSHNEMTQ